MSADFIDVEIRALPKRGLTEETCRRFGYGIGTYSGAKVQVAPLFDDGGNMIAQHIRTASKDFPFIGPAKDLPLFGQHLCPPTGKRIVVAEGEIDCLSISQAFGNKWPTTSLPNGAAGAAKAIGRALEFLSGYDQIVLWFDDDEPGRKAAEECVALLPPGKGLIARASGYKDANEVLQAGKPELIQRAVYDARPYRPGGIVTLGEIAQAVRTPLVMGLPWCLPSWNKATYGRQPGDVIGFGGGTGCGKTDLILQQVAFDVMDLGLTVGVLLLEQPVADTGRRVAGKIAGRRFHVPDGSWSTEDLEAAWAPLEATNRLFLFDHWGAMDWDTIGARIRFMITVLGCQVIYIDHLTAIAAAEPDTMEALEKRIMPGIATIAKTTGAVIHFVSHLATPSGGGKSHEEGGRVTTSQFKGSRGISHWSHQMFGIERNTQGDTEDDRKSTLRCLKERMTGDGTGQKWQLDYDKKTGRLSEAGASDGPSDF